MATSTAHGEAFALAHCAHAACQVVARFIDEKLRVPVAGRVRTVPHGVAFQGQLLRTIAWLRSLAKLDHPGDFQAVTAAARAVFESAVDVTLMHFDPTANGAEKLDAWEESAKLKHAQNVAEYLATLGRQPTDEEQTMVAYATREKDRIEKLRDRWWPRKTGPSRHPSRWTGRDLASDAKAADKHLQEGFEEFYRLRYPQLCWNVHGSGLTGMANVGPEDFAFIGGRAYGDAARFSTVVANVVARQMGCWDEASFKRLAEQVKETRVAVYLTHDAKRGG